MFSSPTPCGCHTTKNDTGRHVVQAYQVVKGELRATYDCVIVLQATDEGDPRLFVLVLETLQ